VSLWPTPLLTHGVALCPLTAEDSNKAWTTISSMARQIDCGRKLYRYNCGLCPEATFVHPNIIDTDHDASPLSIWQYRGMIYHASDASAAENDVHSNTAGKEQ